MRYSNSPADLFIDVNSAFPTLDIRWNSMFCIHEHPSTECIKCLEVQTEEKKGPFFFNATKKTEFVHLIVTKAITF